MISARRLIRVRPATCHGRQVQRTGQLELLVRQHRKRQMQPRRHFGLVGVALRRQPEHLPGAGRLEVGKEIAERAGLRRAAARTRNHVPVVDQADLAGLAGAGIGEHDGAAGKRRQVDRSIVGGDAGGRTGFSCPSDARRRHRPSAPGSCSSRLRAGSSGSSFRSPFETSLRGGALRRRTMSPAVSSFETRDGSLAQDEANHLPPRPQQAAFFPAPVALFLALALVVQLLALGDRQQQFRPAALVEIEL